MVRSESKKATQSQVAADELHGSILGQTDEADVKMCPSQRWVMVLLQVNKSKVCYYENSQHLLSGR